MYLDSFKLQQPEKASLRYILGDDTIVTSCPPLVKGVDYSILCTDSLDPLRIAP